jgi:3-hydroxybutyryl-CoA dehydrogenase
VTEPDRWAAQPLTVGIIGAGTMGRGIAQLFVTADHRVLLADAQPGAAESAVGAVRGMLDRLVTRGRIDADLARRAGERLEPVPNEPTAFARADLVVEAVLEDLDVKRKLFAGLEDVIGDEAILATNTSSLSVTAIAAGLRRPERVCGLHFFNPAPLMRVVEVVPGDLTSASVLSRLAALVDRLGHHPVTVADLPGFLVNHAGRAYGTEALRIVDEQVASPYDVDRICREVAGFPMGPFELLDLTGLDVSQPVMDIIYHGFYEEPRARPSATLRRRLASGRLGRKTGVGYYRYEDGRRLDPGDDAAVPAYGGQPLWVADPALADVLGAARARLVEQPDQAAVCLVSPWGNDVTTEALALGVRPERTLGVDPLGGYAQRLTLATNPSVGPEALRLARSAVGVTGRPVTVIRDSPGFIAQRIMALIVNTACEIAQLGIASPSDLDAAVHFGLGYPRGPLEWGDTIGAVRVLRITVALHQTYLDPRYRPSVWLSRRARLGLSLLATEPRPPATDGGAQSGFTNSNGSQQLLQT